MKVWDRDETETTLTWYIVVDGWWSGDELLLCRLWVESQYRDLGLVLTVSPDIQWTCTNVEFRLGSGVILLISTQMHVIVNTLSTHSSSSSAHTHDAAPFPPPPHTRTQSLLPNG